MMFHLFKIMLSKILYWYWKTLIYDIVFGNWSRSQNRKKTITSKDKYQLYSLMLWRFSWYSKKMPSWRWELVKLRGQNNTTNHDSPLIQLFVVQALGARHWPKVTWWAQLQSQLGMFGLFQVLHYSEAPFYTWSTQVCSWEVGGGNHRGEGMVRM